MTSFEPTGPLGIIMAGALYVNFSKVEKFEENIQQLCRQIDGLLGKKIDSGNISAAPKYGKIFHFFKNNELTYRTREGVEAGLINLH